MLDQPGVHQAFRHRAVVDGGDQHAAAHQLVGPAARRGAEVDAGHLVRQALVPLLAGNEEVPGLLQLEGRAARRLAGELQARDAHRPECRVVRLGQPEEHLAAAPEGQQQAWLVGVLHQLAGFAQGLAQRRLELLAEVGELLALVAVEHLQPQAAALRIVRQRVEQHADAIALRQRDERAARPLAREDQAVEAQAAHQPRGAVRLAADELGIGAVRFALGVAGNLQAGGVLADLGADLTLETGAAVQ
ncbi:hypothetical protein D9M70_462420 [compost metagenome]